MAKALIWILLLQSGRRSGDKSIDVVVHLGIYTYVEKFCSQFGEPLLGISIPFFDPVRRSRQLICRAPDPSGLKKLMNYHCSDKNVKR